MKALVIGRHAGEVPGVEVVETKAVTFPTTASECVQVLAGLEDDATALGAEVVLLQNTPGQVAAALTQQAALAAKAIWGTAPVPEAVLGWGARWGVVVSLPGERPGKVSKNIMTCDAEQVKEAVAFANPRAKTTVFTDGYDDVAVVSIEVDGPPMPFEFSHIEWLLD